VNDPDCPPVLARMWHGGEGNPQGFEMRSRAPLPCLISRLPSTRLLRSGPGRGGQDAAPNRTNDLDPRGLGGWACPGSMAGGRSGSAQPPTDRWRCVRPLRSSRSRSAPYEAAEPSSLGYEQYDARLPRMGVSARLADQQLWRPPSQAVRPVFPVPCGLVSKSVSATGP
jgi:hypothetical protein